MTLKEKADELDQQVRSNTEKMQVSGDDTFVAESILAWQAHVERQR